MFLVVCFLIFGAIFINWKITEGNMNQAFENNMKRLGFVKEKQIYVLEKDDISYHFAKSKTAIFEKGFLCKK